MKQYGTSDSIKYEDECFENNSLYSEANNFEHGSSENNLRSRSISLPYVSCSPRAVTRSKSHYDVFENDVMHESNVVSDLNVNTTRENYFDSSGENQDSKNAEGPNPPWIHGFSKRQVKCGFALLLLSFTDVMGFSIFAPFFPIVAEQKNMGSIEIGLVFGAFSMAGIFASMITGTLLVRVGAKFIILSGIFWSAGATVCFGLMKMAPEQYFFVLCLLCRVLMGIGSASAFTAMFAVIFKEFSERSLTMIGISESLCSIGGILGPLLGGALYDIGGFKIPFMFLGASQFIVLFICSIMIPSVQVEKQVNTVSPARLLLNINGLFAAAFVALSFTINSFIIASLSQFLTHSFNFSAFMVGVVMLVFSVFYGVSTPIWGYIAETKKCGAHMMALSGLIAGILMSFFGPSDFIRRWLGWDGPKEWLVYVVVGSLGTCMGAMIMPTFVEMLLAAKQMKLHSNPLAEYGLVSGLWNSVFSVGDILGPTLGGALVEKMNFENTCTAFGAALSLVGIFKCIHLAVLSCQKVEVENTSLQSEEDTSEERKVLLDSHATSIQA